MKEPGEDATNHQGEGTRRSTLGLAGVGALSNVHSIGPAFQVDLINSADMLPWPLTCVSVEHLLCPSSHGETFINTLKVNGQ